MPSFPSGKGEAGERGGRGKGSQGTGPGERSGNGRDGGRLGQAGVRCRSTGIGGEDGVGERRVCAAYPENPFAPLPRGGETGARPPEGLTHLRNSRAPLHGPVLTRIRVMDLTWMLAGKPGSTRDARRKTGRHTQPDNSGRPKGGAARMQGPWLTKAPLFRRPSPGSRPPGLVPRALSHRRCPPGTPPLGLVPRALSPGPCPIGAVP